MDQHLCVLNAGSSSLKFAMYIVADGEPRLAQSGEVDRIGMEQEFVKVLGVDIPHIVIPVRPGRDLARLIEVAAFQTKLKMSGYNAAEDLNQRLIAHMVPSRALPPPAQK